MKSVIKPQTEFKFSSVRSNTSHLKKRFNHSITINDSKVYQKLFVVLILLCSILIFPESPKELETVCENYYSKQICNVW